MNDLLAIRELFSRELSEVIATDPLSAIPTLAALQKETEAHLRVAVRAAAPSSSWREIAAALGVSKQAAHQRFKAYVQGIAEEMKTEHRAMKQADRRGDADEAASARARRDELAENLRTAARALKDQA